MDAEAYGGIRIHLDSVSSAKNVDYKYRDLTDPAAMYIPVDNQQVNEGAYLERKGMLYCIRILSVDNNPDKVLFEVSEIAVVTASP